MTKANLEVPEGIIITLDQVLNAQYVKDLIKQTCGDDTALVQRGNSFAVRSAVEGDRDVHRVILLPPHGFTANAFNQMNSHDEAEKATIEVKGAVAPDKQGFSKLKNALRVVSHGDDGSVSGLNQPYLTFDDSSVNDSNYTFQTYASGESPFPVVKSDGFGFYHNLINLTDQWLALKLHKVLRPQKKVDLEPHLKGLSSTEQDNLQTFYDAIVEHGDNIFKEAPDVVNKVVSMPVAKSLPALMDMLHVHDSGMHEACTVFGTILKIGKTQQQAVLKALEVGVEEGVVPKYYAKQLVGKLDKRSDLDQVAVPRSVASNDNPSQKGRSAKLPACNY